MWYDPVCCMDVGFHDCRQMTIEDNGRSSSILGEGNSQESHCVEHLRNGATVEPRRSLTAVPTDIWNQLQAEDLSRTGNRQSQEFGVRSDQCWQTMISAQRPRAEESQHQRLWAVDCGRPSSDSTDGRNLSAVEDIDSWLSASVIISDKSPSTDIPLNWNTSARLESTTHSFNHQGSYSEALRQEERSATSKPSSEVPSLNSGTVPFTQGEGRNTATANHGPARSTTDFAPPVANSGSKDGSSKAKFFQPRRSLDSLGGTSSGMFSSLTPVLPTAMRLRGLAGFWPTPARTLGEPSPVATVIPQVQVAAATPEQHSAENQADPTETVGDTKNTLASALSQTRKRKRKRRSVFRPRRRTKKSPRTKTCHPDASAVDNSPTSDITEANRDAEVPVFSASSNPDTPDVDVEAAAISSLVRSVSKVSLLPPVEKTTINALTRNHQPAGVRRALKPIENERRGHFFTSSSRGICKPSTAQRNTPLRSWLNVRTPGSGRNAPVMTYVKRHQSSAGVQKVPSTSPQSDIFEFCGDDNGTEPGRYRPTPGFHRATPSWLSQRISRPTPPTAAVSARKKRGTSNGRVTGKRLR